MDRCAAFTEARLASSLITPFNLIAVKMQSNIAENTVKMNCPSSNNPSRVRYETAHLSFPCVIPVAASLTSCLANKGHMGCVAHLVVM